MTDLRSIIAITILAISAYMVLVNWYRLIKGFREVHSGRDDETSGIPFSFPLAFIAYFVYPGDAEAWIFIIPAVDVTNFAIVYAFYCIARRGITGRDPIETAALSDDIFHKMGYSTSTNLRVAKRCITGFRNRNPVTILSCLAEDVKWEIPGMLSLRSKSDFNEFLRNPPFLGKLSIKVARTTSADDLIFAEGRARGVLLDQRTVQVDFCIIFEIREAEITRIKSYWMNPGATSVVSQAL